MAPAPINDARIFGMIPDYQTITETNGHAAPLTRKQKWVLAMKETVDPFNVANAALTAGFSQKGNQTPKYGEGGRAYLRNRELPQGKGRTWRHLYEVWERGGLRDHYERSIAAGLAPDDLIEDTRLRDFFRVLRAPARAAE